MNETQSPINGLWYCEVFEVSSRLRHVILKTHKHKEKLGIVLKESEIIKPENG